MRLSIMDGVRWAFRSETWKPTKQEWLLALSCVQQEEKQRVMKFVFKKDAKSSLIGRLLLRRVITQVLNIPYNDIKMARTEKGKPFLVNQIEENKLRNFNFNISHQGDYTVLAAEPCKQVGVDVMKTAYPGGTDVPGFFHLMRKQFTPHEWKTIRGQPTEWSQLQMFYRHWCLKESYVKAVGVGIGHDLQAVEFRMPTIQLSTQIVTFDSSLYLNGNPKQEWRFEEKKLDVLHQVAVALGPTLADNSTPDVRSTAADFKLVSFTEIISTAIPLRSPQDSDWDAFLEKRETRGSN